jgi:hypothetical protein
LKLEAISFDRKSQLARIDKWRFCDCPMHMTHIPNNVVDIDEAAFAGNSVKNISVDPEDLRLRIERDFLLDISEQTAIRYVGHFFEGVVYRNIKNHSKRQRPFGIR